MLFGENCYISPVCQESPVDGFPPYLESRSSGRRNQFGQFCDNLFNGFDFTGVKISIFRGK